MRQTDFDTCPYRLLPLLLALSSVCAAAQSLDEVVVSASRSEQRSFDAPAAVQSVGREVIQGAGPQVNLSESLVRVPGLTVLDRSNYAQDLQVSIRGFGSRASFGLRGLRLLIDGIPASTPDGQGQGSSVSLTSTERIEVLRGPMAQLYGNASGGVIQAFTRAAPATPEVQAQYYYGEYGMHRSDLQFGDTLGSAADALGLVADYADFSIQGYRQNSYAQRKQFNAKADYAPNDQTDVKVVFNQFDMPLAQDALGLTRAQYNLDPSVAGTGAQQYSTRKTILQNQLGGSVSYRPDAQSSVVARAYLGARDNLQFQAATVPPTNIFPATASWTGLNRNYYGLGLQYQQRLELAGVPLDWVGGYEFDRSREYRQAGGSTGGQKNGSISRNEDNQAENSDLFVQGNALLSDLFTLTAGVRYSTVRFVSDDYYLGDSSNGSGNNQFSAASPVLGLTLHASDTLNLYANLGHGFETPTLAEVAYQVGSAPTLLKATFNPLLNASTSRHIEVGSKWVPAPGARLDLAVYQIDTNDEIVVATSFSGQTAYTNAPGTQRTGWELSGATALAPHWTLSGTAGAIDAHYTQAYTSQKVTLSGGTYSTSNVNVASGNKLPGIPQTSLFAELAWSSADTPARKGAPAMGSRVGLELVQSGRLYANDTNLDSADGHTLTNLSASHNLPLGNGRLGLYGRVNNLGNEKYVSSVIVNQASQQFYEPGLPRNWSVGVSLTLPL